jgi:uncharacterized protein (UPF0248 family)
MRKKAQLIEYLLRSVHDASFIPLKMWIVVVKHYGAPNNERRIKGEKVLKVDRRGFYYKSIDGETFIPYYRILRLELS